jgi:hypothetical protein
MKLNNNQSWGREKKLLEERASPSDKEDLFGSGLIHYRSREHKRLYYGARLTRGRVQNKKRRKTASACTSIMTLLIFYSALFSSP